MFYALTSGAGTTARIVDVGAESEGNVGTLTGAAVGCPNLLLSGRTSFLLSSIRGSPGAGPSTTAVALLDELATVDAGLVPELELELKLVLLLAAATGAVVRELELVTAAGAAGAGL